MSTPFTITIPDIHVGTGLVWVNVSVPATGSQFLVDTNGTPVGGTPTALGASEGAIKVHYEPDLLSIEADQETIEIDATLKMEKFSISGTFKETALTKLAFVNPTAQFSSGVNTGYPTGAQNYEEITGGGLVVIPKFSVAVVSPRRGFTNPGKFLIAVGYQCVARIVEELDFSRTKETTYKITFTGQAVESRPIGDRVYQIIRQL